MAKEIRFTGKTIDPSTARAIADDVLIQGARPVTWWRRQANDLHNQFMDTVRVSLENGEGIDKLTRRISGGTLDGVQIPGIMPSAKRNAETLARTAVNKITNEARLRTFEENGVVKGLKQVSTLDNRTSVTCIAYDGQAWSLPDYRPIPPSTLPFNGGPPRHFNCRSTTVPILKSWKELGIPADELSPSTRASMDGQVPADQTFAAFLKKKGATFQNELLGPARAKLWRNGKVTLQQMLDFRGNPLSPEELAKIAKARRKTAAAAAAQVATRPPPPKPEVVPEFSSSQGAQEWVQNNLLRSDNTGVGWISSYDREGIRIAAQVTMNMRARFKMPLPSYVGDPGKHPVYRFKWGSKSQAAVHMDSDSLLFKTKGVNRKQNQTTIDIFKDERYRSRRLRESTLDSLSRKASEKYPDDKALARALNESADAGNEWTAGDHLLERWQDVVDQTFTHETGHRLHQVHLKAVNELLDTGFKNPEHRYMWMRSTSEYGATNGKEFFAEQFVHYVQGRKQRVWPPLRRFLESIDEGVPNV